MQRCMIEKVLLTFENSRFRTCSGPDTETKLIFVFTRFVLCENDTNINNFPATQLLELDGMGGGWWYCIIQLVRGSVNFSLYIDGLELTA